MRHALKLKFSCLWNYRMKPSSSLFNLMCRRHRNTDSESGKTTVEVMNKQHGFGLMIDAFSPNGFRLNYGMNIIGPIAIFPEVVLSWNVRNEHDITVDSMALFCILQPKLEILVIGVGDKGNKLSPLVVPFLSRQKIYVEVLPTEHACSTYNFLCSEGRHVAGALLPPIVMRITDEDIISNRARDKQLFKIDIWNEFKE